jgi:hypothetical protein
MSHSGGVEEVAGARANKHMKRNRDAVANHGDHSVTGSNAAAFNKVSAKLQAMRAFLAVRHRGFNRDNTNLE